MKLCVLFSFLSLLFFSFFSEPAFARDDDAIPCNVSLASSLEAKSSKEMYVSAKHSLEDQMHAGRILYYCAQDASSSRDRSVYLYRSTELLLSSVYLFRTLDYPESDVRHFLFVASRRFHQVVVNPLAPSLYRKRAASSYYETQKLLGSFINS